MVELEERIITLETYAAEQDKTITELSDVMADQWNVVQNLQKRLDLLQRKLETLEVSQETEGTITDLV